MGSADLIRDRIDKFSRRRYGWDGYRALPLRKDAADFVLALFSSGDNLVEEPLASLPPPEIDARIDGTIRIEFKWGDRMLRLDFPCGDAILYERSRGVGDDKASVSGVLRFDPNWKGFFDDFGRFVDLLHIDAIQE